MRNLRVWYEVMVLVGFVAGGCTALDSPNDRFEKKKIASSGGSPGRDGGETGRADGSARGRDGEATPGPDAGLGGAGGVSARRDAGEGEGGAASSSGGSGLGGQDGNSPPDAGCISRSGIDGAGCYKCAPTDIVTLETACTGAACRPFGARSRLTKLTAGGALPPLPDSQGTGGAASGAGGAASGGSLGSGGTAGATGTGGGAATGVACESLRGRGQVLYVTGSSASKPFLQTIAQQIAGQNVFIVYTSTGSCVGVDAIVNGTPMTTGASPAPATSATYWDTSSNPGTACDLPGGGVAASLGVSDVFAQSCTGFELVSLEGRSVVDAHGPIQTMAFVVPSNSHFSEISAQAAYFVFGFGEDGGVLDETSSTHIWNDESLIFKRSASSGTQTMISAAIGVPPAAWKGHAGKTSDDVAASIQTAGSNSNSADLAIGILAADYIDTKNLRAQIRMLAFQDTAQRCAVFPDSSATAHDKQNVRDGHYPIWSPLHLLYKGDRLGEPLDPTNRQALKDIIGYLSGTKILPNGVKLIDVYAQSGLVPECAMRVGRTQDGGNITPRSPSTPCSCLFEAKATGNTTCTPCVVQGDCAAGETCSQGYCER